MKKILFVCTGNTCRSPMAMVIFNALAPEKLGFAADSAGLCADGSLISEGSASVLHERGYTVPNYSSKNVTAQALLESELIYCVSGSHMQYLTALFPWCADKVSLLSADIPDPYGGDLAVYRACLEKIEKCVREIIDELSEKERGE